MDTLSSLHCDEVPRAELLPKPSVSRPHDLEQHIKKIISENAAIVETLDPLWSKKYMTSRHHSTSSVPSSRSLFVTPEGTPTTSAAGINASSTSPPGSSSSSGSPTATFTSSLDFSSPSSCKRRYSEVSFLDRSHVAHSRLQSALMGKSVVAEASATLIPSSSSSLVNHNSIQHNKNKNNNNSNNQVGVAFESVIKSGKQVSGDAMNHYNFTAGNPDVSSGGSLVRDLLTSKVPLALKKPHSNVSNNQSHASNGDHPENPERSVIKDLLLKARESAGNGSAGETTGRKSESGGEPSSRKRSSPVTLMSTSNVMSTGSMNCPPAVLVAPQTTEQELSMLYYVCTICNIAFRNKENLEAHQLHYCKGNSVTTTFMPSYSSLVTGGRHLSEQHNFLPSSGHPYASFSLRQSPPFSDPFLHRKISVLDKNPSVLHRRLTEGRSSGAEETGAGRDSSPSSLDSSKQEKQETTTDFLGNKNSLLHRKHLLHSNRVKEQDQSFSSLHHLETKPPPPSSLEPVSLGTILKKTLEGPKKRKISEPVFPSSGSLHHHPFASTSLFASGRNFALTNINSRLTDGTKSVMSAVAVASRKVSVLQPPSFPSASGGIKGLSSSTASAAVSQEDVDSFTRQVSMMLERTKEKQQPITLSSTPLKSSVAVYVPFSGVSVIREASNSSLISSSSSLFKATSTTMTSGMISSACSFIPNVTSEEGEGVASCPEDKKSSLEILSEYLPHVKAPQTKITLKGPLVFPVLERILSEDKDMIEFQVKHPSEVIGVTGLFHVNISPAASTSSSSSGEAATGTTRIPLLAKSNTTEKVEGMNEEKKVKEERSQGLDKLDEEQTTKQQQQQGQHEEVSEEEKRQPSSSSPTTTTAVMQLPSLPPPECMITDDENDEECSWDEKKEKNERKEEEEEGKEEKMQTEDKDIEQQAVDNDSVKGSQEKEVHDIKKDEKEEESPASSLRPSSLDIKNGQNVRKRASSFGPNSSLGMTMIGSNIVSPETPRPKKSFSQQYLNGHAYTYIGLKVSTRSTYCCIYRPQPMFVSQETSPKLSMYSNWTTSCSPVDPFVKEVSPKGILASYDSRVWKLKDNDPRSASCYYVISSKKTLTPASSGESKSTFLTNNTDELILTDSKYWYNKLMMSMKETTLLQIQQQQQSEAENKRKLSTVTGLLNMDIFPEDTSRKISNCEDASITDGSQSSATSFLGCDNILRKISEDRTSSTSFDSDCDPNQPKRVKIFEGGFKSNEDYTYVRGRGRGKYVCEECGIRCKKPSMLKKHIRTHTDLRPYSCRHCAFAFKTKGNLTKHMKSKAHHKKCVELGIIPVPTSIDDSQIDNDALAKQEQLERTYSGGNLMSEDDDDMDDDDDEDNESDDEGVPIPLIGPGQHYSTYMASKASSGSVLFSPEKTVRKVSFASSPHVSNNNNSLHHHNQTAKESSIECFPSRRTSVVVNKNEEQEVAQSLLCLSGSWSESLKRSKVGDAVIPVTASKTLTPSPSKTMTASPSNGEENIKSSSPSSSSKGRKVSILESTLTPGSSWNNINPYFSRPRSFSFNDVPNKSNPLSSASIGPSSSGGHLLFSVDNNNNRHPFFQPHALIEQKDLKEMKSNGIQVSPLVRQLPPKILVQNANNSASEGKQVEQNLLHTKKVNGQRRDTCSPGDRLMIAESDHLTTEEESDEEMIDVEETRSRSFSSTWSSSKKHEGISDNSTFLEEEPMDLSKRSNTGTDGSANEEEAEDMEDIDVEEGDTIFSGGRPLTGKQDYIPIPLASGAEGGEGKCICTICQKVFSKPSQLRLHVNIHYFERPFRCEACAVSFRTKGHLQKHKRSVSHYNKVNMNKTFGTPSNDNPRPFKCSDCKVAFRIHGHLAKHLRSKLHIMKLECLNKLPFGMFAEMERSGVNLNEIDTTDCENSLVSLQALSRKMSSQPGSSLDISNMQLADIESISDEEEVDDDSDGVIDEVVPSPPKRVKVEPSLPSSLPSSSVSSLTASTASIGSSSTSSSSRLFHPDFLAVSSHDLRERSFSFSGLPVEAPLSSKTWTSQERRVTVFSSDPEAIAKQALTGTSSSSTRPILPASSSSQASIATRSNTCDLCGQVFKSAKFLQVHLYSDHSPEKHQESQSQEQQQLSPSSVAQNKIQVKMTASVPLNGFECNVCRVQLPTVSDLQMHLLTHSSPRPFICQVCDAGFTTSAQLAAHMPSHSTLQQKVR